MGLRRPSCVPAFAPRPIPTRTGHCSHGNTVNTFTAWNFVSRVLLLLRGQSPRLLYGCAVSLRRLPFARQCQSQPHHLQCCRLYAVQNSEICASGHYYVAHREVIVAPLHQATSGNVNSAVIVFIDRLRASTRWLILACTVARLATTNYHVRQFCRGVVDL